MALLAASPSFEDLHTERARAFPFLPPPNLLPLCTPTSPGPGPREATSTGGGTARMNGGDGSPVMTDSERRAYRYGQAAPRLQGMRKSWSNDSLAGYAAYGGGGRARASCVCAPTTHPGSFRCKHHRHAQASNLGAAAAAGQPVEAPAAADADADAKHHDHDAGETASAADQEKSS
ncbi:hypothetical protein ACP70R_017281 [Stipagrostis hirtigluma subsp. patula]